MKTNKVIALLVLFFTGTLSFAKTPTQFSGINLINNNTTTIAVDKSKAATTILFLSAKCPCSMSHEPLIRDLVKDFPTIQFIAIHSNQDESLELSLKHFRESKLPLPVLHDVDAKIANIFRALKTPHAFVLNADGEILYEGGITDSHIGPTAKSKYLYNALTEIIAGKKPTNPKTRSLGCIISRK